MVNIWSGTTRESARTRRRVVDDSKHPSIWRYIVRAKKIENLVDFEIILLGNDMTLKE